MKNNKKLQKMILFEECIGGMFKNKTKIESIFFQRLKNFQKQLFVEIILVSS
jgi:hypothetical protein